MGNVRTKFGLVLLFLNLSILLAFFLIKSSKEGINIKDKSVSPDYKEGCCLECDASLPNISTPYFGLCLEIPELIQEDDYTAFWNITYEGKKSVLSYFGPYNDTDGYYEDVNAFIFLASFVDMDVEVQVHEEYGSLEEAQEAANKYCEYLGRVPLAFRSNVSFLELYNDTSIGGCNWWGGDGVITICTAEEEDVNLGNGEELFIHEGCHVTLDDIITSMDEWHCAQLADAMFISEYARDNHETEDVSESLFAWFAVRNKKEKLSSDLFRNITEAIPNRLTFFDKYFAGKNLSEPTINDYDYYYHD